MGKALPILFRVLAFLFLLILLVYGFLAYYIIRVENGIIYDGLGRAEIEIPYIIHFIFRIDSWKGFWNHLLDFIVFITCGGASRLLFDFAKSEEQKQGTC